MADKTREPDIEDAPEIDEPTPVTVIPGYDHATGAYN